MTPHTRDAVLAALSAIARDEDGPDALTRSFREAFLALGSETPDNVASMAALDVGPGVSDGLAEHGLRLAGTAHLLSDVAYALENQPMPAAMADEIPGMTEAHWDAFTRLTTLIYIALTRQSDPANSRN